MNTKIRRGGDYGYNNNRNITENKSGAGSLLTVLNRMSYSSGEHLQIFIVSSPIVIMCTIDYYCKNSKFCQTVYLYH
jgi:hypothetical protein